MPAAGARPLLAAVADGVGGEAGGARASAAAIDALRAAWEAWRPAAPPTPEEAQRHLVDAGHAADAAVRRVRDSAPALAGAATTLTAATLLDRGSDAPLTLLHAGDSRAYAIEGAGAVLLTQDHTWVAQEVAAGAMTPGEAAGHAMRNVIVEFLGREGGCRFDVIAHDLGADHRVLLCTDGVSNVVDGDELAQMVGDSADSERAAAAVVALVDRRAGADDATVVAIERTSVAPGGEAADPFGLRRADAPPPVVTAARRARRPLLVGAAAIGSLAAAGTAGVAAWGVLTRPPRPAPDEAARAYLDAWAAADYARMYAQLTERARGEADGEAFARRHDAVAAEMTLTGAERRLGAAPTGDGDSVTFPLDLVYRTARFGELRRTTALPLVWERERWAVDWRPAVLLPELTGGRLVRAASDAAQRGSLLDRAGRPFAASVAAGARAYPQGDAAGPLVGYVGQVSADELKTLAPRGYLASDVVGRAGLEAGAEALLAGQRGGRLTIVDPTGAPVETLATVPPRAGESVTATIDLDVQREVEAILGDRIGSAVVIDPRSGAIRALASAPRYDPNLFVRGGDVGAVLNDPRQPLIARPLQGQYPPGSTFKVVTMAAALESGAFTLDSEFTCTGRWTGLPGLAFDCWLRTGHGTQRLVEGLTHSCNSVFYEIGKRLDEIDPTLLPSTAARSGFGESTGVAAEMEAVGVAPSPAWKQRVLRDGWARGDAVNMAIGQGQLLVTPLQLAAVYAAIATSGQGPGLRLLERSTLPGGSVERQLPAGTRKVPWGAATFEAIRAGLRGVVGAPTGTAAFVFQGSPLAATAAGKTGTAETSGGRQSHAWFACYAPSDAPKAVVLVMLEHGGEGSGAAAPLARRILEAVLDRL